LPEITEHGELHAAEGLVAAAVDPQRLVDPVQQIGPYHRYLVDDQQFQRLHDAGMPQRADRAQIHETRWQAKEGMDGLAADIDRRQTGWRHDRHVAHGLVAQQVQQRGLAGAGAAGDEHVLVTALDQVQGALKIGVRLQAGAQR
jgi:hypothetical protein